MSNEVNDNRSAISFNAFPGPITFLFLLFAITGNCGLCGFDKDYVEAAVECER